MEVKDWIPGEKESFTTPGGAFRPPTGGSEKSYEFYRQQPERAERGTAAPRDGSPFARGAGAAQPWYAGLSGEAQAAPTVIRSHDGETQNAVPLQPQQNAVPLQPQHSADPLQPPYSAVPLQPPYSAVPLQPQSSGGPQVYTIQLPPQPRQPAPKRRSLWWVPLLLIAALLAGLFLGILVYPLLTGVTEPAVTQALPREDGETAAARVYRENADSVVSVIAVLENDPAASSVAAMAGTGFLISDDGYLLTNAHVVQDAVRITVTLRDGREFPARLAAAETEASDLALLKIEARDLRPVTLGNSDAASVGDQIFTIGNPFGDLSFSLTAGYLSAKPRRINLGSVTLNLLQTNAAFNVGNSGGPLFDAEGRVIGVVTAKLSVSDNASAAEGLGLALPINDVMTFVEPWLAAEENG